MSGNSRCYSRHMSSTSTAPHPLHLLLPQLGTEEDFATLRETLRACGFHNQGICQRLEIPSIIDFVPKCDGRKTAAEIEYPADPIIRPSHFGTKSMIDGI